MTSRELVIRAISQQPIERPPREIVVDPQVAASQPDEVSEIAARFPSDIIHLQATHADPKRSKRKGASETTYTDPWGSTWQTVSTDNGAPDRRELLEAPLADLRNLSSYQPPMNVLDGLRLNKLNRLCEETNRFAVASIEAGLVERVLALRGPQAARKDLASATKGIRSLLTMVHEYCRREVQLWAESEADAVVIRDDFSTVPMLLEDRGLWRELIRPLYRDYFRAIRGSDKFVVFRVGGDVIPVLTDLIRCGIDVVQCAAPGGDVDRLAKRFRGKVTFQLGLDRPEHLIHGCPAEVRDGVTRVRRAFDFGSGGIIATCPWTPAVPLEHVIAFCEQWLVPMPVHA